MTSPAPSTRPTAAGMYDFYLGGTAHTPTDAAAAQQILDILPDVSDTALANRGFLQRAVRWLAAEQGVRQFLDVGSGLPTQRNTHDVVAESTPDGRVVYVDIDPVAVAQANELLVRLGATAIQGDLRDPASIVEHSVTRRLIDFSKPVGLLMVAVLHFVHDDDEPVELVRRYVDALPSGSYLVLSHASADSVPARIRDATLKIYANTPNPPTERTKSEIARFFDGLEIVPPYHGADRDVAHVGLWGAEDPAAADSEGSRLFYAAVARKP